MLYPTSLTLLLRLRFVCFFSGDILIDATYGQEDISETFSHGGYQLVVLRKLYQTVPLTTGASLTTRGGLGS